MRILFVETKLSGHHKTYLLSLLSECTEAFVAIPSNESLDGLNPNHVYQVEYRNKGKFSYFQTIKQLKKIAHNVKPDIIHFLYGDDLYQYFGFMLKRICSSAKIVITCHQIRRSRLHDLSYRNMSRISDSLVVHTDKLCRELNQIGIKNIVHIEYPQFGNSPIIDQKTALAKLGVDNKGHKVLLAIGGTRNDKGLDILLMALKHLKSEFHLIIAGKEEDFKRDFIEKKIESFREKVSLLLGFLTDEQFALCINAADIIVLPYRRSFDGASGPLGEGVWHNKMIVGPDHKSLGELITSNHLGLTFKCEDSEDLQKSLVKAIGTEWHPDEKYRNYRYILDPSVFNEKYRDLYYHLTD